VRGHQDEVEERVLRAALPEQVEPVDADLPGLRHPFLSDRDRPPR